MKHVSAVLFGLIATTSLAVAAAPTDTHTLNTAPVGSRDVAAADPALPRPDTKPCVVQLLAKQLFGRKGDGARMDAQPHTLHYAPPERCKGPWAKVVLEAHFSVGAGHQYDRTASIWLDGVNLYFGTTQEPSPGTPRSWNIQRDLTDYGSLLRDSGTVEVRINNWMGPVFSAPIHASARLLFYPADKAHPAPRVPDRIIALNGQGTTPAKLDRDSNLLSRQVMFPRNTTRVYLDLFAEPQSHDEFYYVCLDAAQIKRVGRPGSNGSLDRSVTCDGGSFREVLVSIDGTPAGLAPVTPWLYTGALNPFLWQPTPGPEALNFIPYRLDLSPFAGLLSDGKPHTVSIKVISAPHFFSIAGALLVYQDAHAKHTGGTITRNTLADALPQPSVDDKLTGTDGHVNGSTRSHARTHYVIEGYVDTANGRVKQSVNTTISFNNTQRFGTGDAGHRSHISWLHARADSTSQSRGTGITPRSLRRIVDYTLDAHTLSHPGQGKNLHRAVQVRQQLKRHVLQQQQGLPPYMASTSNAIIGAGKLTFQRGKRLGYTSDDQSSTQLYRFSNSLGDCYRAQVQAQDRKVTAYTHGQGCIDASPTHWFVHPDGSPDGFGWRGRITPGER